MDQASKSGFLQLNCGDVATMSDFVFKPEFIPRTPLALAMRGGLLSPIAGMKITKDDGVVVKALWRVLRVWRKRLLEFRELGWSKVAGVGFQYLRNCEPCVVSMAPSSYGGRHARACNQVRVCPWCYGRRVMKNVFDTVLASLPALGMEYQKGRKDYPYQLSVYKRFYGSAHGVKADLKEHLDGVQTTWDTYREESPGMIALVTAEPWRDGLRYRQRFLLIRPADKESPSAVKVVRVPSLWEIGRAVATLCRYPAGMLRGDAGQALVYLTEAGRTRTLRTFGAFYGRAPGPEV